jgi:short-subunit dehydrogenase
MSADATRPLALVTGASSGIGLELAKQFAAAGFDLVVAAEDAGLHTAAEGLAASGVAVEAVQADLATEAGVDELWTRTVALGPLGAAALNAGIGAGGPFAENDLERELAVIDLNVRGTVHLAKHVVQHMVARGEGRILFTSSIAATQPGTWHAVYNASKSFVQSFSTAIGRELKDTGITVTALMPGPTETEFFERAGLEDTRIGQASHDDPEQVAKEGFEALMAGEAQHVAGSLTTKAQGRTGRLVPDAVKAAAHDKLAEPGSGS